MRFPVTAVRAAATAALEAEAVLPETAAAVVAHMIRADLWGRRTHGLSVRFAGALARARQGAGSQRPKIVSDAGATVVVDDHDGFGTAVDRFATDLLVERVSDHGIASVAVRNTGHTGMLGDFADHGVRRGFVTLAFGHCRPWSRPPAGPGPCSAATPWPSAFPPRPTRSSWT